MGYLSYLASASRPSLLAVWYECFLTRGKVRGLEQQKLGRDLKVFWN